MSRLRRIADTDRIFFVTTNLVRTCRPLNPAERDVVLQVIAQHRDRGAFWLFAYCVMPNHVHLLLALHNKELSAAIREIKSVSGARIIHERRTRGPIWQARYFDSIVRRAKDFWPKVEYIHDNPVAAKLVTKPIEWPWSSYGAIVEKSKIPIPIDSVDLPNDRNALLWPAPWK
jgi:REP element-mobilizing transposase RayT